MKRNFKSIITAALSIALCTTLVACSSSSSAGSSTGGSTETAESSTTEESTNTTVKSSPDKYTWYVKNYVGDNAASIGYEGLDGQRYDTYGASALEVVYVADDGTFLDPGDDELLQNYVVYAQNLPVNTEIDYTFLLDEDGEEYDNLVDAQNYEEIVLAVHEVGAAEGSAELTEIEASPDKYTRYVNDYVGRNLAACGYVSISGNLVDTYADGVVTFNIKTDDGLYVDPEDEEALASYVVTAQDIAPNTAITLTYLVDDGGEEYSNLVDAQSIEEITLTVEKIETAE